MVSCYEAGYDGFWLHRLLQARGIENDVFDPARIAVERRSRWAKRRPDRWRELVRTLMAHCRSDPRVVRIIRVPSTDPEDARRATRERHRLVGEQTAHTNRPKALLRLLGIGSANRVGLPTRSKAQANDGITLNRTRAAVGVAVSADR